MIVVPHPERSSGGETIKWALSVRHVFRPFFPGDISATAGARKVKTVHSENIYTVDVQRCITFEIGQKLPKLRFVKNSRFSRLKCFVRAVS